MKHKALGVIAALAAAVTVVSSAAAAQSAWPTFHGFAVIPITINGKPVNSDVPPILFYGKLMVPIRVVAETFGAKVGWDSKTNTASIMTVGCKDLNYATWDLSDAEIADAKAWARAGRHLTSDQIMPMYTAKPAPGISVQVYTPYASVVASANPEGPEVSNQAYRDAWAGRLRIQLCVVGDLALAQSQVLVVQNDKTIEPVRSEVLVDQEKYGIHGRVTDFTFDGAQIDRTGPIDVKVSVGGQEYSCHWELGDLK